MDFDNLTILGDDIQYDILEEDHETKSFNDTVWVKTKEEIRR